MLVGDQIRTGVGSIGFLSEWVYGWRSLLFINKNGGRENYRVVAGGKILGGGFGQKYKEVLRAVKE